MVIKLCKNGKILEILETTEINGNTGIKCIKIGYEYNRMMLLTNHRCSKLYLGAHVEMKVVYIIVNR